VERGVERTFLDAEVVLRDLPDPLADPEAMLGTGTHGPHDQEIEGSADQVEIGTGHGCSPEKLT
jgi:hypothetical protein